MTKWDYRYELAVTNLCAEINRLTALQKTAIETGNSKAIELCEAQRQKVKDLITGYLKAQRNWS